MNFSYFFSNDSRKALLWFAFYFLLSLYIGVFVKDITGQPPIYSTIDNFAELTTAHMYGDPLSFAQGAKDISKNFTLSDENAWLVRTWPPGFMALEGAILYVFGDNAYFLLPLIIFSAFLSAVLFLLMRKYALYYASDLIASTLPLVFLLSPHFRLFILEPYGLIQGESFAILFFLISLILCSRAVLKNSYKQALYGGVFLALSAYFRSQFELIITFMILWCILIYVIIKVKAFAKYLPKYDLQSNIRAMAVYTGTAVLCMLPWRVLNGFSWVSTKHLVFVNASRTDAELHSMGGGWLVSGKSNMACHVNESYCGNPGKMDFYLSFLKHPFEWIYQKAIILPDYWFSSLKSFALPNNQPFLYEHIFNIIYIVMLVSIIPMLAMIKNNKLFLTYFWKNASFMSCMTIVYILIHFETRYFYLFKIFTLYMFLVLLIPIIQIKHNVPHNDK